MRNSLRRALAVLGSLALGMTLLVSCGADAHAPQQFQGASINPPNTVTMLQGEDVFDPFILPTQPDTTVTWRNADTIPHVIVTTPEQASYLNQASLNLTVAPGQTASFTFTQPGLYHYYDSTVATWSAAYQRVAPNKGVPKYPMAMEGVVWVQGAIPNLPASAQNYVVHLRDQIAYNFVAIRRGGTVSFQNQDTDPHMFQPVLGWDAPINPVDIGLNNLLGEDAVPPHGQTRAMTFTTPGLYYYYCYTHGYVDPVLLRAYARDMASEYPIPMEGFILVADG